MIISLVGKTTKKLSRDMVVYCTALTLKKDQCVELKTLYSKTAPT